MIEARVVEIVERAGDAQRHAGSPGQDQVYLEFARLLQKCRQAALV